MRTAECKALENIDVALESIGMRTTECKALGNIIDYYKECGKHVLEQDNEPVDHRDESSIYPVELITLNAFPAMGDKPGRS